MQNLINLAQTLKAASNPMATLQQMAYSSPQFAKFQEMTQGKSAQEIEQIARNLAQTKGINIDQFRQQLGI